MIIRLARVLSAEALTRVRAVLDEVAIASSSRPESAVAASAAQLPRTLGSELVSVVRAHTEFEATVHPAALAMPSFAWHPAGSNVASERVGAFAADDPTLRVDVRVLLWLSERSAYEGGEVVIDEGGAVTRWSGEAGDAIAYPASARCRFEPVSRGGQLTCTLDVQSLVAGESERRILFDFHRALQGFEGRPESREHAETMRRLCNELIRMWAVLPRTSAP